MPERQPGFRIEPYVAGIGSAMHERIRHRPGDGGERVRGRPSAPLPQPRYPAHRRAPQPPSRCSSCLRLMASRRRLRLRP